jgi:hypothetical protein
MLTMQLDHQLVMDLILESLTIDAGTAEITATPHGTIEEVQAMLNELARRRDAEAWLREEYLSGTWDDVSSLAQALAGVASTNLSTEATAAVCMPIVEAIDRSARALAIEAAMDPRDRPVPF